MTTLTQVGWVDERGILFPLSSYSPEKASQYDAHKAGWKKAYTLDDGEQPIATEGVTDAERLAFLHASNEDPEGYEYGVARVKFHTDWTSVLWTASDHSDIDSIIRQQKRCEHKMFALFNGNLNKRCTWCGMFESVHLSSQNGEGSAPLPPAALAEARAFGAGLDAASIEQPSEVV